MCYQVVVLVMPPIKFFSVAVRTAHDVYVVIASGDAFQDRGQPKGIWYQATMPRFHGAAGFLQRQTQRRRLKFELEGEV